MARYITKRAQSISAGGGPVATFDSGFFQKAWDKWYRYVTEGGNVPKPGATPSFWRDVVLKSLGDYGRVTGDVSRGVGSGVGGAVGSLVGKEDVGRSLGGAIGDTATYFVPIFGTSRFVGDTADAFGSGNVGTGVGSLAAAAISAVPAGRVAGKILPAVKATGKGGKLLSSAARAAVAVGQPVAAYGAAAAGAAYDDVARAEAANAAAQGAGTPPDWLVKTLAYGLPAAGLVGSAGLLYNAVSRARRRKSWLLRALGGVAGLGASAYLLHSLYSGSRGSTSANSGAKTT